MPHTQNPIIPQSIKTRLLTSFSLPTYRWVWASTLFFFMTRITTILMQGWLVLQLTDSPFWVGLTAVVQGVGQFAFSIFSGVLIDRLDRRRVVIVVDGIGGMVALTIALLALTEQIALWHVIGASFMQGVYLSFRWPATSTIVYAVVGPQRMLNASASQMLGFNIARVLGSTIVGGLIAAWGVSAGYFFAAACSFSAAILMLMVHGSFISRDILEPFWQATQAGINYTRTNKSIWYLLGLSVVVEMFGYSHLFLLPLIARDMLEVGATGLGFLSAAGGIGALLSTVIVGSLGDYQNKGVLLISSTVLGGLFLVFFAFSPWYMLSLALITIVGATLMAYDVTLQTLLLLLSNDAMRGRVQGLFVFTISSNSFGALILGGVASVASTSFALAMGGGIIVAAVLYMLSTLARLKPIGNEAAVTAD